MLDELNRINFPLQLRARFATGWDSGNGWKARVAVNYTGGYKNDTVSPTQDVGRYTTVDGRLAYELGDASAGLLRNVTVALEATNLFDTDPPYVFSQYNYDYTNGNPLGRVVEIGLKKRF